MSYFHADEFELCFKRRNSSKELFCFLSEKSFRASNFALIVDPEASGKSKIWREIQKLRIRSVVKPLST